MLPTVLRKPSSGKHIGIFFFFFFAFLLFEAEVLPEVADCGLDIGAVLIVRRGDFLPRRHGLLPQSTDPGWAQHWGLGGSIVALMLYL